MILGVPSLMAVAKGQSFAETPDWDTVIQITGANVVMATASLPAVIPGLIFPAQASSLYEIECHFRVQSSDANGVRFGIVYSGSGATVAMVFDGTLTAATSGLVGMVSFGTESSDFVGVSNTNSIIFIKATVSIGSIPGNVQLTFKKTSTGTGTIYIGSVMKIRLMS